MLSKSGTVMPNPVSGKVFFIFKIYPLLSSHEATIDQAFLLHDKGRSQIKAGQFKDAYVSFEKAMKISESIISSDSRNADAYFVKAILYGLMGHVQLEIEGAADKELLHMSKESFKKFLEVAPIDYDAERLQIAKKMLGV
jgi:tetratricopeptide (TPR) repeat protein